MPSPSRKQPKAAELETTQSQVFSTRKLEETAAALHQALLAAGLDTSVPDTGHTGSKVRLPLGFFDNTDLERHTPAEWVELCQKSGRRPDAVMLIPDGETGGSSWKLGRVLGWEGKNGLFTARLVDPSGRTYDDYTFTLGRLAIMFLDEPIAPFVQRLTGAHRLRDEYEAKLLLQFYVKNMPVSDVRTLNELQVP